MLTQAETNYKSFGAPKRGLKDLQRRGCEIELQISSVPKSVKARGYVWNVEARLRGSDDSNLN